MNESVKVKELIAPPWKLAFPVPSSNCFLTSFKNGGMERISGFPAPKYKSFLDTDGRLFDLC